ncbi:MAG: TSUP family transporter, partial [Gammaproteobacteria bacterium]|nr:TSUP family transporter [Gammaproteobacteria bacterium]
SGFVRSGLGFGGAALGLPLMLLVSDEPLFWLPMIGIHLLIFTSWTLRTRIRNVDWSYFKKSLIYILPAKLVGVFGLLNLPNNLLIVIIYSITMFYALLWLLNLSIHSERGWTDKLFLITGGYVSGTSLTGAPLIVAVFMQHIARDQLRNTLFVMWFVLVTIKLATFVTFGFDLHVTSALLLVPAAAIGHVIGLKTHDYMLQNDRLFKRILGGMLILISILGLSRI